MHTSKLATVSMAALVILVVFRQVVSLVHYSCIVVIRKIWRDDKPDGLDIVTACLRPKSICEGNDAFQQFITKNANNNQRQALTIIYSGHAKAKGPFVLFANTIKDVLERQFADINVMIIRSIFTPR